MNELYNIPKQKSASEAVTDEVVDKEILGEDLAKCVITARSSQIDRRNQIKNRNSLREKSPELLRAKNTKVPKEYKSIILGKTALYPEDKKPGRNIGQIVPTMNLSSKLEDLSENCIKRMKKLIQKYESGYIMTEDSEQLQDNYFLENFHIFLENVPVGEALALVSFLIWTCDSCKAYFFTEYRFCPICSVFFSLIYPKSWYRNNNIWRNAT